MIAFLVGITFGVVGGAFYERRRRASLQPASDDLLSAGARVICGVYIRYDGGCRVALISGGGEAPDGSRGDADSGSYGQGRDR